MNKLKRIPSYYFSWFQSWTEHISSSTTTTEKIKTTITTNRLGKQFRIAAHIITAAAAWIKLPWIFLMIPCSLYSVSSKIIIRSYEKRNIFDTWNLYNKQLVLIKINVIRSKKLPFHVRHSCRFPKFSLEIDVYFNIKWNMIAVKSARYICEKKGSFMSLNSY